MSRSHIPKFGSWDADNVPYTAYFENARKDKGTGVMMNPNDPEENPDAFIMFSGENNSISSDKIIVSEKPQKIGSKKSISSESISDKGSVSDHTIKQQNYKFDRKKSSNSERSNDFPPPSPGPNRPKYGYNPVDDIASHRSASVPIFGAWDEKDPRSGDGFTVIFQKVKEEKHIAASKFPPIPQQPSYAPNTQKNDKSIIKKWCCLC